MAFQPVRGISADHVTNIPKEWSKEWFRGFIRNHMEQMDVRNAVAGPGISIASDAAKPSHTLLARAIISTGAGGPAFPNQSANQVLAGPPSGAPGSPTFRAIVPADIQTITPVTWTGQHTFNQGVVFAASGRPQAVELTSTLPIQLWSATGQAVDAKNWEVFANGDWVVQTLNDASSIARDALRFHRTGFAILDMAFGNATDNPTFSFKGLGGVIIDNGAQIGWKDIGGTVRTVLI